MLGIPVCALWWHAESVLLAAGQDEEVARLAGMYTAYCCPALYFVFFFEIGERYLQAHSITLPAMAIRFLSFVMTYPICYFWVLYLDLGFFGGPLTIVTVQGINCLALMAYLQLAGPDIGSWTGMNMRGLHLSEWLVFLKLGLAGLAMTCIEWWFFELLAIVAGWMGTDELAVQTLAVQTLQLLYFVGSGVSIAASIRVGNFVGAGDAMGARRAATSNMWLGVVIELLLAAGLFVWGPAWTRLFTDRPEVLVKSEQVLHVTAGFVFFDGMQEIASGILQGVGRQSTGVVIKTGFVVVASLACYVMSFYFDRGIVGLWEGVWFGSVVLFSCMMYFVYSLDWADECNKAMVRMAKEQGSSSTHAASAVAVHSEKSLLLGSDQKRKGGAV
jgi:MATE family multidrug resistance protein